jgi:hypothetical protein
MTTKWVRVAKRGSNETMTFGLLIETLAAGWLVLHVPTAPYRDSSTLTEILYWPDSTFFIDAMPPGHMETEAVVRPEQTVRRHYALVQGSGWHVLCGKQEEGEAFSFGSANRTTCPDCQRLLPALALMMRKLLGIGDVKTRSWEQLRHDLGEIDIELQIARDKGWG